MISIVHCMYEFAFQFPQKKCYGKFISAFLRYHLPWFFLTLLVIFRGSSSNFMVVFSAQISSSMVLLHHLCLYYKYLMVLHVVVFALQISSPMVLHHHLWLCLHYKYQLSWFFITIYGCVCITNINSHGSSSPFMVVFALQISTLMVLHHHLWLCLHYKYQLSWFFITIYGCVCTTNINSHGSSSPFMVVFALQISTLMVLHHHLWLCLHYKYHLLMVLHHH